MRHSPQDRVAWPFTAISHIRVDRGFAAWILWQMRKRKGRAAASRVWWLYRAINGRSTPGRAVGDEGRGGPL